MVEAQSASVSCSHTSASPTPSRAPSEDETAARKAVDTLAEADPDLPLENVGEMADNARDLIYRISDSRLKNELLEKVDECLLPVVERSVRNDLTLAREEFSMGLFNEAEEHVYEARAKYRTYLRMNDASIESRQLYQQAMALLHDIDKGLHPSWYYHVETIKRIDDVNQAVISDRQGNTYHLRENEIFAHFMVKEIDRSKGVVLERDGEVEVVRR